jgi:hypothetical protein
LTEDQKPAFRQMMNMVFTSLNKPKPENDTLRLWWSKLERYEIEVVMRSLDNWIDTKQFPPAPADIIELCRHKVTIHSRLPSPLKTEENKAHAAEIKVLAATVGAMKRDGKEWARKILKRVENGDRSVHDIVVKYAREALAAA